MSKITGRFYFKLTANGNLLGEYSNNQSSCCVTEAANRILEKGVPVCNERYDFVATYKSVWRESGDGGVCSDLSIRVKEGCSGIYSLEWKSSAGVHQFDGEGMLCDEILVGNYWSR
jgi:hypothetical protein